MNSLFWLSGFYTQQMKSTLSFLLISFSITTIAQKKSVIIHANQKNAEIYEQGNSVSRWTINPKTKLDIYTTNKFKGSKTVKFKTDIDSVSFHLRPGQKQDFIVVLDNKDSCVTRIQARIPKVINSLQAQFKDTVSFQVNKYNTNLVKVLLNGTDTLQMNFDSGATEMSITADALADKVRSDLKLYTTLYDIKIGKRTYQSRIYDTQLVGHDAQGLLGWDLFDGLVVELNYNINAMVIHSKLPAEIKLNHHYSRFKIHYINDRPFIKTTIMQNRVTNKNLFMFDLGYQKTAMLDGDLLEENKFPAATMRVIKKTIMHGTHNNEIPVITANLQQLQIGPFKLKDVPAQIITQNKPMRGINIHILGNEVLKRFNTFLDFQHDVIYLMPNNSYHDTFADEKKG
jgi:hypothetical protein